MKRAYIPWQQLTEKTKPQQKGKYLVSTSIPTLNGQIKSNIETADWLDEGDSIQCECADRYPQGDNVTPEDRLEAQIYGGMVTVDREGFYILRTLGDPDLKEHPGFYEYPTLIGTTDDSDVYWAELPIPPKGMLHPTDAETLMEQTIKAQIKQEKEDLERFYTEQTETNPQIKDLYKHITTEDLVTEEHKCTDLNEMRLMWSIYTKNDTQIRRACILTTAIINTITEIQGKIHEWEEALKSGDKERGRLATQELADYTNTIINKQQIDNTSDRRTIARFTLGTAYRALAASDFVERTGLPDIIYYDAYTQDAFPKLSGREQHIFAVKLKFGDTRIKRYLRLNELSAPHKVIDKEAFLIFEAVYALINKEVRREDVFDEVYGFTDEDE